VKESFWTKKQSWTLSKVDIKKWRLFFVFVCLNGCHFPNHKISRNLTVRNLNFCSWWTQFCVMMTKIYNLDSGGFSKVFLILAAQCLRITKVWDDSENGNMGTMTTRPTNIQKAITRAAADFTGISVSKRPFPLSRYSNVWSEISSSNFRAFFELRLIANSILLS